MHTMRTASTGRHNIQCSCVHSHAAHYPDMPALHSMLFMQLTKEVISWGPQGRAGYTSNLKPVHASVQLVGGWVFSLQGGVGSAMQGGNWGSKKKGFPFVPRTRIQPHKA